MRIDKAAEATPEVHAAVARLLPQLNRTLPVPNMARIQAVLDDPAATLMLAMDGDEIVAIATVLVYSTPAWTKARIEDLVVDESARGRGVGEALVNGCIDVARDRGAEVVELQSGRWREAANRLYRRMGFELRDSNLYRLNL